MNPLILDATTKSITVVLAGAKATNDCGVVSSWADNTGTVFTEGSTDTVTNGTTPVTIVAAPGASTRRIIKSIYIQNADTAPVTATVTYVSAGGSRVVAKVTLAIGDTWSTNGTYDTNGALKQQVASFSGILPVANGGTGLATLTTNSYYKGNGTSAPTARTYSEVRTDLGLSTSDSPQFNEVNVGAATDTTLQRSSAGILAVEGVVIPTISSTATFTNKRIDPRIVTAASYTTDTGTSLTVADCDQFQVTAQAGVLKFNNPGGTPVAGNKLIIRIKDDGTARALTYDTQFRAMGNALPSTTVISKTLYMGFIWNATDSKWDLVAVAQEA